MNFLWPQFTHLKNYLSRPFFGEKGDFEAVFTFRGKLFDFRFV